MTEPADGKPSGATLTVTPIGFVRSPFTDRASAPRQPAASEGARGVIELVADGRFEYALEDLDRFQRIWVLFWFHLNEGWKSKVLPPRSAIRRGVFATRSPYRPNPIGMSVLRLERIEGLSLHVLDVDVLDGTPVLDIKPYIPYADAFPDAGHGWLDDGPAAEERPADPGHLYEVRYLDAARTQIAFLRERGTELFHGFEDMLSIGPTPHPYRRIRRDGDGFRLAIREWRVRFRIDGNVVTVERLSSGHRPSVLFGSDDPALADHRAFVEKFGS